MDKSTVSDWNKRC